MKKELKFIVEDIGPELLPFFEPEDVVKSMNAQKRRKCKFPTDSSSDASTKNNVFLPFLGIGIGTTFNVYYSPRDGWFFLPVPNLNAAYSF